MTSNRASSFPNQYIRLCLCGLVSILLFCSSSTVSSARENAFSIPPDDQLPGAGPIHREDWFQNLWRQRRGDWSSQVEQDQGALVFLGDSITQGWSNLAEAFSEVKVANRGISGDTSRGVLTRLQDDVISLNPAGVVLLIGTNDLELQASPETITANVKEIVAQLETHNPKMPIVLCRIFPSSASKRRDAERIQQTNELYAEAVRGHQQITILDTWKLFANREGDAKPDEFPDLLHPNAAGYAKWQAALRPILATLGFADKQEDEFQVEPGFELLFNGQDLTGWGWRPTSEVDKKMRADWREADPNAPPWPIITEVKSFDGETSTDDGRYVAKNGRLIVTTPTEGRRIQALWTMEEFPDDFELKLEFRATPNADSGVYLRGRQLQCRDYWLAGPYTKLANYRPQQWNEMHVIVKGRTAHCTCNGQVLEEAYELPETGPIGFEADRGQMEYRRIRIKRSNESS